MKLRLFLPWLLFSTAAPAASIVPGGCDRDGEREPWRCWELSCESGYLWNVGSNTPIDYEIAPTQVSFRGPANWAWRVGGRGHTLAVRPRFSLLGESIVEGPEDYYFGLAAAPSVEWWLPAGKTSLFLSVGGGVGLTNSTRVPGGQGQDFTLNWFAQLGVRHELRERLSLLAGVMFLHHSNGGQTDPNPGIDALGFTVGAGWRF